MKNPWIIVGAVTVVLIAVAVWYSGTVSERNNEGITFEAHTKGNPDAAVTLVKYSDLQCPACASSVPVVNEILAEYGDRLRFEYKHFPLPIHNLAKQAARANEAAGQQGAFFAYQDLLFANQGVWKISPNPTVLFFGYAEELDFDVALFKKHLNASLISEKVNTEGQEARELGVTGTPTFFLNGTRMAFSTYEEFKNQIVVAIDPSSAGTSTPTGTTVQFGI